MSGFYLLKEAFTLVFQLRSWMCSWSESLDDPQSLNLDIPHSMQQLWLELVLRKEPWEMQSECQMPSTHPFSLQMFQLHHSFLFMHSGDYWNLCGYKESLFLSLQFWRLHLGGVWGPGSISALLQSSPKSSLGKKTFWLRGKMKQLPQEQ